ncbi:MAG: haloacid dehalogenase type II, partial [Alphaproteobacteria bacterium]|nr:haloacid dehalogenase type II [Alphaproteobacteria bacterium]
MSRSVYVFDAYGTLLDVHSAVARYQDVIGPQAERLSELWRSKQLEYTWVRTLMGAYQDFAHLTEQALDYAAARCGGVSAQTRADLLNAYQTLNAYSDAAPCLRELRQRGARTGILSNGTQAMLQAAISAAGLTDLFDAVISVDELGIYKTAPVVEDPTPFKMIRTTNVRNGCVDISTVRFVTEETYKIWTRRQIPKKGDVILTREAPMGEVGMILTDDNVFLGQRLVSYR